MLILPIKDKILAQASKLQVPSESDKAKTAGVNSGALRDNDVEFDVNVTDVT